MSENGINKKEIYILYNDRHIAIKKTKNGESVTEYLCIMMICTVHDTSRWGRRSERKNIVACAGVMADAD